MAAPATDEELKAAIAKELKRRETYERGVEHRKKIVEHHKTTVPDMIKSGLQSLSLEFGDELYGAIAAGYKSTTGDERPIGEIYEDARDEARYIVEKARTRTPVGSFITDVFTPNPAKFIKGAKAAMGPIRSSMAIAAGATESEDIGDIAADIGTGAVIGTGTKALGMLGAKAMGDPQASEARYLGLKEAPVELRRGKGVQYIEDIKGSLDRLRKKGMFSKGRGKFSTSRNKWGVSKTRDLPKAADLDEISIKMDDAMTQSSGKIEKILEKKSPMIVPDVGQPELFPVEGGRPVFGAEELTRFDNSRISKMQNNLVEKYGMEESKTIGEAIEESWRNLTKGDDVFNLMDLHKEKQRLYRSLQGEYAKANLKDSQKIAKKELARLYKDMINEHSGDTNIAKLNETMEDVFNFQDSVGEKLKRQFLESPATGMKGAAYGGVGYRAAQALEGVVDPTRPYRAKAGRIYQDLPEPLRGYIQGISGAAPERAFIRGENEVVNRQMSHPGQMVNRSPQSTNLPTELINTPLPRDTESFMANKEFVLAKVAQEMPEVFEPVQMVFERSPEQIKDLLPALSVMAPSMFEQDKYNRIDGFITLPEDRDRARKDIMKDDDLSNTEKIQLINGINKDGVLHEY